MATQCSWSTGQKARGKGKERSVFRLERIVHLTWSDGCVERCGGKELKN